MCPQLKSDQLPRLGADKDVRRAAGGRPEPRVDAGPGPGQGTPSAGATSQPGDETSKVQ